MKKRLFSLLLILALTLSLCAAVHAEGTGSASGQRLDRVTDLAGVIDESSLAPLNEMADKVSEKYGCDVAVVFVPSLQGQFVVTYSDNFFLDHGYGMGPDRDGILLLVSVGDREYNESTSGAAIYAFTDYGLSQKLEPRFTPYLGRNDWAGAAEQFIRGADELLAQAQSGTPYDYYEPQQTRPEPKSLKEKAPLAALISAVIGFFSGGIPTAAMKKKMKSVAKEYGAANYVRGGLNLRYSDDRFLHASMSRTPIPHDNGPRGGGGGSSVHVTSGHTFGGSHGKF